MQVKIEDQSTVKKLIHVEVAGEDVTAELDKAYKDIGKTASIKGFRKGKVPRKVLENRFGKDVNADVISKLIQNGYAEAIKDNNISNIVGPPSITETLPELEQGKPFNFSINIEVKPQIADIDFKGIELKKNLYKPSDEEIAAQLQMIRQSMATKQTVTEERPVKDSDFVLIDYQGFVNGEPFEQTPKIENYLMAIGNKDMPDDFSKNLTGVIPPQEIEIDVVYPTDDSIEKEFAGKTVTYKVNLKEIQENILPPLDDTLAQKLGQFEKLEDVKDAIRSNLEAGYKVRVHQELSEQIFTKILEKVEFELPEAIVEAELSAIVAEAEQAYQQHNITLESVGITKEMIREQYYELAQKQAKRHLILEKIILQEKLELTQEDMDKMFEAMAKTMNATADQMKTILNNSKDNSTYLDYIKMIELEKKAIQHIIDNSNMVEVEPEPETADTTASA